MSFFLTISFLSDHISPSHHQQPELTTLCLPKVSLEDYKQHRRWALATLQPMSSPHFLNAILLWELYGLRIAASVPTVTSDKKQVNMEYHCPFNMSNALKDEQMAALELPYPHDDVMSWGTWLQNRSRCPNKRNVCSCDAAHHCSCSRSQSLSTRP